MAAAQTHIRPVKGFQSITKANVVHTAVHCVCAGMCASLMSGGGTRYTLYNRLFTCDNK